MTRAFFVPGPLPGLNEIIAACKSGRGKQNAYARMKSEWSGIVAAHARSQRIPCMDHVTITLHWYERRVGRKRGRDPDNIMAAVKFVLDGLVDAGVLADDGVDDVRAIRHEWTFGLVTPGVQVAIESQP